MSDTIKLTCVAGTTLVFKKMFYSTISQSLFFRLEKSTEEI